jgi:hypothetical protein
MVEAVPLALVQPHVGLALLAQLGPALLAQSHLTVLAQLDLSPLLPELGLPLLAESHLTLLAQLGLAAVAELALAGLPAPLADLRAGSAVVRAAGPGLPDLARLLAPLALGAGLLRPLALPPLLAAVLLDALHAVLAAAALVVALGLGQGRRRRQERGAEE